MTSMERKYLLITAGNLDNVLRDLTDAMQYFDRTLKKKGLSSDSKNWKIFIQPASLTFYSTPEINTLQIFGKESSSSSQKFGSIVALFRFHAKSLSFNLRIDKKIAKILFADVLDVFSFKQELASILLKHKKINRQSYDALIRRIGTIKYADAISYALEQWTLGYEYSKAVKYAKQLDKLSSYLPKKFYKAPRLLYRAILVAPKAFERIKQGKPLILKNRKYSSWTTNITAAQHFADNSENSKNYIRVVLRKTFTPDEILLNIEKLGMYLYEYNKFKYPRMLQEEQEVLIKNPIVNFRFTPENIYKYSEKHYKWKKFNI